MGWQEGSYYQGALNIILVKQWNIQGQIGVIKDHRFHLYFCTPQNYLFIGDPLSMNLRINERKESDWGLSFL